MGVKERNYWTSRAKNYQGLEWANDRGFISEFIKVVDPRPRDFILDVGTGRGIIAEALKPKVKKVIGLDVSNEMMRLASPGRPVLLAEGDIRDLPFQENTFDKVTARHVFHHVTGGLHDGVNECYRVLKKGGKLIVAEGVPPSVAAKEEYEAIFRLKEDRLVFMEMDLALLLIEGGFGLLESKVYWLRGMSVRNWLDNSGLDELKKEKLYKMHKNGSEEFTKAYNLKDTGDDILIDMKMVIVVGVK